MKKRNILIILLLAVGILGLALVEGYIKPRMKAQEERYIAEQADTLTHDFGRLLKFKSPYMGDASNLANLNANLPLGEIPRRFQLHPDSLMAEIYYQATPTEFGEGLFEQALIYAATANFVLIGNLDTLVLNYQGISYAISRCVLEGHYGLDLSALQNEEKWTEMVQRPLKDRSYVKSFIAESFAIQPYIMPEDIF